MELFDIRDTVAVITGSSRGIGKAIAVCMAKAGAKVVVSSRKLDACQAVVDEITAQGGEAIALAVTPYPTYSSGSIGHARGESN